MRIAMYYGNQDVRVEEMPRPQIGPGEMLIKVEASGICGTDVLQWYRINRVPLVLGHEIAGIIAEVGQGVRAYKVGERVAAAHHVSCDVCHYCLSGHQTVCETLRKTNFEPGGFSEYVRLPAINVEKGVFPLPDTVSFEKAVFTEPLACVLRGQRLAGMRPGKAVLIIGSGVSGILHLQLARFIGANHIVMTDINEYRLDQVKQFGADLVLSAKSRIKERFRQLNQGRLADLVIVTAGAKSAIAQALQSVERGGTVLFFAPTEPKTTIPLSINDLFWRNEISLTSSYGGSPEDYQEALDIIGTKRLKLKEMITHRLPLEDTARGFGLVAEAKESLKVIIEPQK